MIISFSDSLDARQAKEAIAELLPDANIMLSENSRGYGGELTSELILMATPLVPLAIAKIAEIIMRVIETKGSRTISINGVETKGFNIEEVIELLQKTNKLENPVDD